MMRAIVFDLDDTLYPHDAYRRSGFAAVAQHVARVWGHPADDVFATLCRVRAAGARGAELQGVCRRYGMPERAVPDLLRVYRGHSPSLWLPEDVAPTLRQLRANGWRLAILTNGVPQVQAAKIDALGLRPFVDHVVFAHEHAPDGTPAAACFIEVVRRTEVAPEACVCVGDDPVCDIRGARAVGMRTIRIVRHADVRVWSGADAVVSRIAEVPAVAALIQTLEIAGGPFAPTDVPRETAA